MSDSQQQSLQRPEAVGSERAFQTWPTAQADLTKQSASSGQPRGIRRWLKVAVGVLAIGIVLAPILVFAAVYRQARMNDAQPADAIVVLGAAQFNGVPSQVFQARLDTAYELYRQGYAPTIIVTGGRLPGDQFTEAEAGKNYLVDRGVPADAILMENVSHNTAASFEGVRRILEPRGIESLLLVSDGFHLYRSKMLAEDAGFEASVYASENGPIRQGSGTELRYMIRETFGVLAWKLHIKR